MKNFGIDCIEIQLLQLISNGYTDKQISEKLKTPASTINSWISVIRKKLDVKRDNGNLRVLLVRRAIFLGLILPIQRGKDYPYIGDKIGQ